MTTLHTGKNKLTVRKEKGVDALTRVLGAESRAAVIIVEHIGGERSFDFVAICIFDNFSFGLLLLT